MSDRVPLAEAVDKTAVPTIEENAVAQEPNAERSGLSYMDDPEYHRVANFFEVSHEERRVDQVAQKLSFLYDWAKEVAKSEDRITRLEAIRGLQRKFGIQGRGLETIKKIYQYARLDQDKRRIEREQDLLIDKRDV